MQTIERIYLDHNATTRPFSEMAQELSKLLLSADSSLWGNPSSIHMDSRGPKNILRECHRKFSKIINCNPLEVVFNSGASEGNNTVFKSVWSHYERHGKTPNEYLISNVEHPSVAKVADHLSSLGAIVKKIPVSRSGEIDLDFIQQNISDQTALVSVMLANNETGAVFPISQISKILKMRNILFHVDCVQALGKLPIDVKELQVDYATFSAHKFYALKGTGALYVKKGAPYENLIFGGGQERHRRGGTENIVGLWAFEFMLDQLLLNPEVLSQKIQSMEKLRNSFESLILKNIENVSITNSDVPRICNTSSLVINGVDGETLLMSLDLKGFAVSTGAACSSGSPEPSPVLLAMGLSRDEAQSSLRVSVGWETTEADILKFSNCLIQEVKRLREIHLIQGKSL